MSDPRPGEHVANHRLVRLLGRGAAGAVFEGHHLETGARRAVKLTLSSLSLDELARCQREGEALARVVHPALLQVHSAGVESGRFFLVTELAQGGSLHDRLSEGTLSPEEARRLFAGLAQALAAVHGAGIVHRDIKPANILLTREGLPKLADFGLAQIDGRSRLTETGALVGTPIFMAPEQVQGAQVGPPADVYSLGASLYCALSGRPPIAGSANLWETLRRVLEEEPPRLSALCPGLERSLGDLVTEALRKDPGRRPTALDFARRLHSASPQDKAGTSPRRQALVIAASLLLVALLIGAGAAISYPLDEGDRESAVSRASPSAKQSIGESPDPSLPASRSVVGYYAGLLSVLDREGALKEEDVDLGRAAVGRKERLARGVVRERLDRARLALEDYDFVLENHGPSAVARLGRARIRRALGDFNGSLSDLDHLLAQEGTEPSTERQARLLRIQVFFSQDRPHDAISETEVLLGQDPRDISALVFRAHAWQVLGELEKANLDLDRALEIEPRSVHAICERAYLHKKAGRLEQAAGLYERVLRLDPGNVLALGNLGALYLGLNQPAKAERTLRKVIEVNPRDEVALANLALLALRRNSLREALALAERVLELRPDEAEHYILLANVQARMGEITSAIETVQRALEVDPTFERGKKALQQLRRRQRRAGPR